MKNFITKVALFAILSSCNLSISASAMSPRSTTSNSSWEEFEKSIPLKDQMRIALLDIKSYSAKARNAQDHQDKKFFTEVVRVNVKDYFKAVLPKSSKK